MENRTDRPAAWNDLHRCRRCRGMLTLDETDESHPATHCVCPGGAVWRRMEARPIGRQMRLLQARMSWEAAKQPRMVYYFRDGVRCEMDLSSWRRLLAKHWEQMLEFEGEELLAS